MFGRGSWAVFGVRASSREAFERALSPTSARVAMVSQVEARRVALEKQELTVGINGFAYPRGDENAENPEIAVGTTEDFRLGPQQFGIWFVLNGQEDVTDPKSKQEAISYDTATKPFKFLKKEEKQHVESLVEASAVASRKQFPVLIDFVGERVYAETIDPEEIGSLRSLLSELGAEVFSLSWQFGSPSWPSKFLAKVWEGNKYRAEMSSRADDLQRFHADEIEKLEDKMLESIVSGYFSMAELETGQWAGLATPAKIRLFATSEPSSEAGVSTAFTLMSKFEESAQVASASVVFQHLDSKINRKTDEEKQYRTDLFTIDVNDKANISDAGAAALRGFDLPQYKKDMKRHAKDRGSLEIKDFWMEWLVAMKDAVNIFIDNVTETLQIDKNLGMLPYTQEEETGAAEV